MFSGGLQSASVLARIVVGQEFLPYLSVISLSLISFNCLYGTYHGRPDSSRDGHQPQLYVVQVQDGSGNVLSRVATRRRFKFKPELKKL